MNYEATQNDKRKKKLIALVLVLALLIGACIGGTIAYLSKITAPVVNTFTYGDIELGLYETEKGDGVSSHVTQRTIALTDDLKGKEIPKDPTVTIGAGSEACYVFVKVTKENWPGTLTADINVDEQNQWIKLEHPANTTSNDEVYYREMTDKSAHEYQVLKAGVAGNAGGQITAGQFTAKEIKAGPKITFIGYAVAKDDAINTPVAAWNIAKDLQK